jgi:hypothetical protein
MKPRKQNHGLRKTGTLRKGNGLERSPTSLNKGSLGVSDHKTKLCSRSSKLEKHPTSLKVKAKAGSTRLLGDKKEAQVQHTFETLKIHIQETQNSGATNEDGDLLITTTEPDYLRAEVKYRNTDGFTVNKKHWHDIKKKALTHGGTPALITINKSDEKLITMSLEDLALLIQGMTTT